VEVDELSANGVLGLVDAVARFDASKRVKLESYARHRIRGAILDGLRAADPSRATHAKRTSEFKSCIGNWKSISDGPSRTRRWPRHRE